jgi:hypothetical protein
MGDISKYVIRKAPCRVIITAPPAPGTKAAKREAAIGAAAAAAAPEAPTTETAPAVQGAEQS